MKIQVTQEDINNGVKGNCPIALCINKIYPDKEVSVGYDDVAIQKDQFYNIEIVELPLVARQFVHNFDNDKEVFPFEFELDI